MDFNKDHKIAHIEIFLRPMKAFKLVFEKL